MSSPRFLTPGDCARALRVSDEFIRGEINDGRLPARKFERASGRSVYRIDPTDFETYLERYWPAVSSRDVSRETLANLANPANAQR